MSIGGAVLALLLALFSAACMSFIAAPGDRQFAKGEGLALDDADAVTDLLAVTGDVVVVTADAVTDLPTVAGDVVVVTADAVSGVGGVLVISDAVAGGVLAVLVVSDAARVDVLWLQPANAVPMAIAAATWIQRVQRGYRRRLKTFLLGVICDALSLIYGEFKRKSKPSCTR